MPCFSIGCIITTAPFLHEDWQPIHSFYSPAEQRTGRTRPTDHPQQTRLTSGNARLWKSLDAEGSLHSARDRWMRAAVTSR